MEKNANLTTYADIPLEYITEYPEIKFELPATINTVTLRRMCFNTVQDIINNMQYFPPKIQTIIEQRLRYIRPCGMANKYPVNPYPKDKAYLQVNDQLNLWNVLLLENPAYCDIRIKRLNKENYTVAEFERLLDLCHTNGKNALGYSLGEYRKNDEQFMVMSLCAANLFRDQVMRQYKLYPEQAKSGENIFLYEHQKRIEIVETNYPTIVNFLLADPKDFIWGWRDEIDANRREKYIAALYGGAKEDKIAQLALYATVPEWEQQARTNNYGTILKRVKKTTIYKKAS